MLAQMMFGVPMMAAAAASFGTPALYVAPMAAVIPGFMFAAFTDVHGHRVGDTESADATDEDGDENEDAGGGGNNRRRNRNRNRNRTRNGMSMIMQAIRTFQGNGRRRNGHHG